MDYRTLPILREGDDRSEVVLLRRTLNHWLAINQAVDTPLDDRSDFNSSAQCYVQAFQTKHQGVSGQALDIDGVVGTQTWYALSEYSDEIGNDKESAPFVLVNLGEDREAVLKLPDDLEGVSELAVNVLNVAIGEVGVIEDPSRKNRGERVDLYQKGLLTNPTFGLPWCASFVSWCMLQAVDQNIGAMPFDYTASSRAIEKQLTARGQFTRIETIEDVYSMRPGDVLVWFRCGELNPWVGHIGFVHNFDSTKGTLRTIEGNRRDSVWAGTYKLHEDNPTALIRGLVGFGRV